MNLQSEQINELADALSKAQGQIEGATKDSKNPFFKSSYADLHSVMAAAREPLASNGLSVVQPTQVIDGQLCLITILMHKSGQWIKSIMPLVLVKQDPQSVGSALTYFRRYCYASLCGVAQMDDDCESAMERKPKVEPVKEPIAKPTEPPSSTQLLYALAKTGVNVEQEILDLFLLEMAKERKTTVVSIVNSALASIDQLNKIKSMIEVKLNLKF